MGRGGGEEEEGGDLEVGNGCSSKMHGMKGVALSIIRGVIALHSTQKCCQGAQSNSLAC